MGRIRTIKPEFTQDEELSSLPAETHLFAAGLLCYSDDDGYFNAHHALVKAAIFPLRESSVSPRDMLNQLAKIGFIRLGTTADGKHYGQVVKFTEHQRVNRPTPSKIKALAIQWGESVRTHGTLTEDSLPERKGKEGKGTNEIPPCRDEQSKETPEDLHPLQYAAKILEDLRMPQTQSNVQTVAAAMKAVISDGRSGAEACDFLRTKAKEAQDEGVELTKFWFEDAKWKPRKILEAPKPRSASEIARLQQEGKEWRQ